LEPKNIFLLICKEVLQNIEDTRQISCINIFDTLYVKSVPHTIERMTFVSRNGLGIGSFVHHFEIHDASRCLYKAPPTEFVLLSEFDNHTDIFSLDNITIESAGLFWIKSFINEKEIAQTPLMISLLPVRENEE